MPPPIPVELVPHDSAWVEVARAESERLAAVLGRELLAVHQVGSTAIPGILAKPILDLLPVVRSVPDFDAWQAAIEGLGYAWWGEYGIDGRRYCTLNDGTTGRRLVQLHCFAEGSAEIVKHLAFRDYLLAHPAKAAEYEREKIRCCELHPGDSHAYSDAKATWIAACLAEALEWYVARGKPIEE